jgi:hypothetical protein
VKQHLSEFFKRLTKHSEKSTTIFEGHCMFMKRAPGKKDIFMKTAPGKKDIFMKMAPGNKKGSYTYNLGAGVQSLSYITAYIKV